MTSNPVAVWFEPLSSKTKNSTIAPRANAISRMRAAGLDPKHQILNNEASAKYKAAIIASGMTYQLVPPTTIDTTLPRRLSNFGKITLLLSSAAPLALPPPPVVPSHPPGRKTTPPPPPKQHQS